VTRPGSPAEVQRPGQFNELAKRVVLPHVALFAI
jgi:hypothetical protein